MSGYVDDGLLQVDVLESDLKFALDQLKQRDNQAAYATVGFVLKKLKDIRKSYNCTAVMDAELADYIGILEKVTSSLRSSVDLKSPIKVLKILVKSLRKDIKRINKGKSKSSSIGWAIFGLAGLCFIVYVLGGTVGDMCLAIFGILLVAIFWKVILWFIVIAMGVTAYKKLKK